MRLAIAGEPDDTLEQVRRKERALAELSETSVLSRWKKVADLWCSAWFRDGPARTAFHAVADTILGTVAALHIIGRRAVVLPRKIAGGAPPLDPGARAG